MHTSVPQPSHRASRSLTLSLALLALFGCQRAPDAPANAPEPSAEAVQTAMAQIQADYMRDRIAEFSADEFEGRGPATAGDEKARAYLASQLEDIGFSPAGADGSWEQPFDVIGITAKMPQQWSFQRGGKSLAFDWWDEYIAASGVQTKRGAIKDAEVVFVGYGIQAPEYGWDDFKGQNLEGKVLLMLNNDPDWDPELFAGATRLYYGRWTYKYESAARQGAAGAIIIHTTPSAGYPFQVVQTSWSGEQVELPSQGEPQVQVKGWLTEDAARELVAFSGNDLDKLIESARSKDFTPVALGVKTSLAFENTINKTRTANVYGVLEGSDPELRDEYVIYTAHHDHLGIGEPDANGDTIYNGARDNASGVAQLLAIGKAFKALPTPPRRSVMLLFVAAEEQGLLGSKYFAANPTVEPGRIAANLNFDSANIWGRTKDVVYVGKGKSTLDAIVEQVAQSQGRVVTEDQFPDRGSFYRSDQFSFAKIGVPAVYLKAGTDFVGQAAEWGKAQHEENERLHYHQPSDELSPTWNFEGMVEDAVLGFRVGLHIANADELPSWVPGDEFEAARKQALAALEKGE
jgi:Zn-dependent M28 family amino/carboxypeptidase